MKMKVLAAALVAVLLPSAAAAQSSGDFGIGLIVAEPTGLSAKLWLDDSTAIDAAAAWSFSGHNSFQVHADWLMHRFDLFPRVDPQYGRLPLYFGLGGRLKLGDDDRGRNEDDLVGIRVPVGVSYLFAQAPFDVFAEVVPVLDLAPDTELDLNAAVGGRFYFGRRDQLRR